MVSIKFNQFSPFWHQAGPRSLPSPSPWAHLCGHRGICAGVG